MEWLDEMAWIMSWGWAECLECKQYEEESRDLVERNIFEYDPEIIWPGDEVQNLEEDKANKQASTELESESNKKRRMGSEKEKKRMKKILTV